METFEAPVVERLPVFEVVRQSYRYVWEQRGKFSTAWLLIIAASTVSALTESPLNDPIYNVIAGASTVLGGMLAIAFYVGVIRRILLQAQSFGLGVLCWGRPWLRYVLASLGFALVCLLSLLLPLIWFTIAAPPGIFGAVCYLLLPALIPFFVTHRLILIFPAAAIGERSPFALSLRSTAGNVFRLFTVGFLTFLPLIIPVALAIPSLLATVAQAGGAGTGWSMHPQMDVPLQIVFAIFGTWAGTVFVTALALSYERLARREVPAASAAEA